MARDNFSPLVKRLLSLRANSRCSRCGRATSGPAEGPNDFINIGVAAHITAAAEHGPRFQEQLSAEERKSVENGIWLCAGCGTLVDKDPSLFSVEQLLLWKQEAEQRAASDMGSRLTVPPALEGPFRRSSTSRDYKEEELLDHVTTMIDGALCTGINLKGVQSPARQLAVTAKALAHSEDGSKKTLGLSFLRANAKLARELGANSVAAAALEEVLSAATSGRRTLVRRAALGLAITSTTLGSSNRAMEAIGLASQASDSDFERARVDVTLARLLWRSGLHDLAVKATSDDVIRSLADVDPTLASSVTTRRALVRIEAANRVDDVSDQDRTWARELLDAGSSGLRLLQRIHWLELNIRILLLEGDTAGAVEELATFEQLTRLRGGAPSSEKRVREWMASAA